MNDSFPETYKRAECGFQLLQWIQARGGSIKYPLCKDKLLKELGDHFGLTVEQRNASTSEADGYRNKWDNEMRRVRELLVNRGELERPAPNDRDGWWIITASGSDRIKNSRL